MIFYEFWAVVILIVGTFAILLLEYLQYRNLQPYVAMLFIAASSLAIIIFLFSSLFSGSYSEPEPQFFGLD